MTGSKELSALQQTWRHATMQMAFIEIRRCLTDLLLSPVMNAIPVGRTDIFVTYLTLDRLCLLLFPTTWHARSTEQESILMILILSQYIVKNCPYCTKEGQLKSLTINNIHVCNS